MGKKIFSGVQPTGNLHLGNYLGAIKNFVNLNEDEKNSCIFCVVDLHAITVNQDPKKLRDNTRETVATFLASGINSKKSIIFNQSQVSAHSEAAWILSCTARMGWLNRMTQFKEKAGKNKEKVSSGLYTYPNLMAADILLYLADLVPVGDDQKQHLELTRDIAQKFNNDYSEFGGKDFFPIPEPLIFEESSRVMSLRDGTKKMSKSETSSMTRIELRDENDLIIKKISKAKTDPFPIPESIGELDNRPEVKNLLNIFSSLGEEPILNILNNYSGKQFSDLKNDLSDLLINRLSPIRQELIKIDNDEGFLREVLNDGAIKAKEKSEKNIKEIKKIIGLG
ncbi:MAG: tryptophan--tRNA ligase [Candidatus Marinimicrobia bacterium TMED108]|nr:MAG: tryptophan--tRNA ligase [Candidatus Marinimicrobia bacterium TMED108]